MRASHLALTVLYIFPQNSMQSLGYMSTEETTTSERTSHILQLRRRHEGNTHRLLEPRNALLLFQHPRKPRKPRSLMLTTLIRTFSEWKNKESKPKVYKPFQKCVRRTLPNPAQPSPAQLIKVDWIPHLHSISILTIWMQGETQKDIPYTCPKSCSTRNLSHSLSYDKKLEPPKSSSQATPHKHNLAPPYMQVRRKGKKRNKNAPKKNFTNDFLNSKTKTDRQTETERNGILLSLYLKSYLRICSTKWAFLHQIRNLKSGEREVQEVTYQREVGLRVSEEKHRHHRGRAEWCGESAGPGEEGWEGECSPTPLRARNGPGGNLVGT